jgi:hypothetical protein
MTMNPYIQVILSLVALGVMIWILNGIEQIDATVKRIIIGVAIVGVIFWCAAQFGYSPAGCNGPYRR